MTQATRSTAAAPETRGPAMGRYAGDRYFSGGAYYFSTLGAAEFYYALAEAAAGAEVPVTADNKEFLLRLGAAEDSWRSRRRRQNIENAVLRPCSGAAINSWQPLRPIPPPAGELSEQFDQATGVQTSAKSLDLEPRGLDHGVRAPEGRHARRRHRTLAVRRGAVIDKLEFLIALARERNFSRAAESCGVTQPTLSAGIKQLEDTLGVLLVNRSSRFYGLTAEGERVLEWARRIVGDARAMRQDVHASKTALAGHLTLAAVPTALPMVAELTTPFRAKHPDVRFTVLSQHIPRNPLHARRFPNRRRPDLSRQRAARPAPHGAALPGAVQALDLRRKPARRARGGDLGGCRAHSPLPAHPRHAKPPHHRPAPGEFRSRRRRIESNSMVVLFSHARSGGCACIVPEKLANLLGVSEPLRSIPITEPRELHIIGLVSPHREPIPPLTRALVAEANRLAMPQKR